ncbi:MAG: 30S ribosomal protein S21 [Oscillospiraceae bacterium]|jgi:ribosomal protein S21|nr:30S ribosomal protein S21 [Oscillospiraceae bacterium]
MAEISKSKDENFGTAFAEDTGPDVVSKKDFKGDRLSVINESCTTVKQNEFVSSGAGKASSEGAREKTNSRYGGSRSSGEVNQPASGIESLIRSFLVRNSGIVKEVRNRSAYIKPCVKRKQKRIDAERRKNKRSGRSRSG